MKRATQAQAQKLEEMLTSLAKFHSYYLRVVVEILEHAGSVEYSASIVAGRQNLIAATIATVVADDLETLRRLACAYLLRKLKITKLQNAAIENALHQKGGASL